MMVFDLICPDGHRFEAWFRDAAAYDEQAAAGTLACPSCGATAIAKAPTRLNIARGGGKAAAPERASATEPPAAVLAALRRRIEATCDYVGGGFPEEARRIHYGEATARGIYGEATGEDAARLAEEGIEVHPMPWFNRRDD